MDWRAQLRRLGEAPDHVHFASHLPPPDFEGRESAVLIAFAETDDGLDLLLIERARDLSAHSGQPAFPGGAREPQDRDLIETALREAHEETGMDPTSVAVLAVLPRLHVSVSRFAVTPVIVDWHTPGPVFPNDPAEVAAVLRIPVRDFIDPRNRVTMVRGRHRGPAFLVSGLTVWGFTGAVIAGLLSSLGWDEPWDTGRTIGLDAP